MTCEVPVLPPIFTNSGFVILNLYAVPLGSWTTELRALIKIFWCSELNFFPINFVGNFLSNLGIGYFPPFNIAE